MTTILKRAETRSISIAASPREVVGTIGDGANLPRWAPKFAHSARPDGPDWLLQTGDQQTRIRLCVSAEAGTVDIVSAEEPTRGAFLRVVPNGDGSELLFTLFFAPEADRDTVAEQMATVESELEAVRSLCERRRPTADTHIPGAKRGAGT